MARTPGGTHPTSVIVSVGIVVLVAWGALDEIFVEDPGAFNVSLRWVAAIVALYFVMRIMLRVIQQKPSPPDHLREQDPGA